MSSFLGFRHPKQRKPPKNHKTKFQPFIVNCRKIVLFNFDWDRQNFLLTLNVRFLFLEILGKFKIPFKWIPLIKWYLHLRELYETINHKSSNCIWIKTKFKKNWYSWHDDPKNVIQKILAEKTSVLLSNYRLKKHQNVLNRTIFKQILITFLEPILLLDNSDLKFKKKFFLIFRIQQPFDVEFVS